MHRYSAVILLALLCLPVQAQPVLRLYNWLDYIDRGILDDFTNETGIQVIYESFDSHDELEATLLAGGSGYDVVVPNQRFLARQIPTQLFQPLDKSRLPNLSHTWPWLNERQQVFDPGNRYSVNYLWGTHGIGYNEDMVSARIPNAPVDSWALAFDPTNLAKLADCGVYFPATAPEIFPLVMHYLGLNPASTQIADLERAAQHLLALRPFIREFLSWEAVSALANGEICLAIGLSGDISQATFQAMEAESGISIRYSLPQEGSALWFDQFAIPSDAPNADNAHVFLNYMLRPEVSARASNHIVFANGNVSSQQYIEPDILADPTVYPDAAMLPKLFVAAALPPAEQRVLEQLWAQIQAAR